MSSICLKNKIKPILKHNCIEICKSSHVHPMSSICLKNKIKPTLKKEREREKQEN